MLDSFLTALFLMEIVLNLPTSSTENKVVYNIGAEYCPCMKFCNENFQSIYDNRTDNQRGDQPISSEDDGNVCDDNDVYTLQNHGKYVFTFTTNLEILYHETHFLIIPIICIVVYIKGYK